MSAGTIAVVCNAVSRYTAFHKSLAAMRRPEGTALAYVMGANIAENRNVAVRSAMGEWVWFVDDDQVFGSGILEKLLARGKDIIVPTVLHREPPHAPVVYSEFDPERREFKRIFLEKQGGIQQVAAAGTSGMLVRRAVFEALADPWFEVGQIRTNELSEDLWFCKKATERGFEVWVDWETTMGHLTPTAVWPMNSPEGWMTAYHMGGAGPVPTIDPAKGEQP